MPTTGPKIMLKEGQESVEVMSVRQKSLPRAKVGISLIKSTSKS